MAEQRPTIEWVDNVAIEMEMKFDAPFKDGENEYGKWYLWTVEVDGEDHSMFAKQDLEYLLEAAEPAKGDVFVVKPEKLPKTKRAWHVWKNGANVSMTGDTPPSAGEAPESTPAPQEQKPPSKPQTQPRGSKAPSEASYEDLVGLMGECMKSTAAIWDNNIENGPPGDHAGAIERLAVTLYLDCRKAGIWPTDQVTADLEEAGFEPVPDSEPPDYSDVPDPEEPPDLEF